MTFTDDNLTDTDNMIDSEPDATSNGVVPEAFNDALIASVDAGFGEGQALFRSYTGSTPRLRDLTHQSRSVRSGHSHLHVVADTRQQNRCSSGPGRMKQERP